MHALTDAILGAIGEGDIGTHFPPSDPQWKGAASRIFLVKAVELLQAKGGVIANADITILAEAPKIAPHVAAMKAVLAPLLHLSPDRDRHQGDDDGEARRHRTEGRHHGLCDGHGPACHDCLTGAAQSRRASARDLSAQGATHCHGGKLHGRADRRRSHRSPWVIGCGRLRLRDLLQRCEGEDDRRFRCHDQGSMAR